MMYVTPAYLGKDHILWYSRSLGDPPEVWKNTGSDPHNGIQPGEVSLHPGSAGQLSVVRWTSPLTGNININGYFGAGDIGWMSYYIYKNGTSVSQLYNAPAGGPFTLTEDVSIGDTIDFIVGLGADGNGWGSTPLHATITATLQLLHFSGTRMGD